MHSASASGRRPSLALLESERTGLITEAASLPYETPFFYTSREVLKKNYETFTTLFDNAEVLYALKANSDPKSCCTWINLAADSKRHRGSR